MGRQYNTLTLHCNQFSSVAQSCPTLCDPMNRSMPGLPIHHQLPEFTQIHVHRVGDAIQPSHPLSSPSPPAPNPSQHQGLSQWVNSSHKVAKIFEFQLQHQSFQCIIILSYNFEYFLKACIIAIIKNRRPNNNSNSYEVLNSCHSLSICGEQVAHGKAGTRRPSLFGNSLHEQMWPQVN